MAFFWYDRPVFQVLGMNSVNLLILLYNGLSEPFETEQKRRMEYFNEGCLALITYFLFFYSDYVPDEDLKYMCGWAQVVVFGLNLFVNCFGVIKGIVKDTFMLLKQKYNFVKSKCKSKFPQVQQELVTPERENKQVKPFKELVKPNL
jgi:hypothetical protein